MCFLAHNSFLNIGFAVSISFNITGLGDACTASADCSTTIAHSECKTVGSSLTCICMSGYRSESGSCTPFSKFTIN